MVISINSPALMDNQKGAKLIISHFTCAGINLTQRLLRKRVLSSQPFATFSSSLV